MSTTMPPARRPAGPPPREASGPYRYDVERPADAPLPMAGPALPQVSTRRRLGKAARIALMIVSSLLTLLGLLALYFFVIAPMGVGTSLVAFTAALVPVAIVLSAVWWLDRYTPQSKRSLIFAFSWGAVGSVLLTLLVGEFLVMPRLLPENPHPLTEQFLGAVIQAPIVEEAAKSLGLLFLLAMALFPSRRCIEGPLDGVVYAALMAGGFAFTENILYFGSSFQQAQAAGEVDVFWQTFLLRGLLSPFAHVSFTALCGLGIGIGAERRSAMLQIGLGVAGLCGGMLLHALWNGSTFFIEVDPENPMRGFFTYYLTVQVPIFLLLTAIMVFLRWRERRIVRRQLSDYGRAGWFSPEEVELLVSMRRRARAERWARHHGALPAVAMRRWIMTAVKLASTRHSARFVRASAQGRQHERSLLEDLTASRRLLGALSAPVSRGA